MNILYINYNYNNETNETYSFPIPSPFMLCPFNFCQPPTEAAD